MSALDELIEQAKAKVAAMSPVELAAMHQAQRESFVRAMQPCEHGIVDFEQCPDCRKGRLLDGIEHNAMPEVK